jgi:hypothetical protein
MAIKGPKHAFPTQRGWVHGRTGELLKSQRISIAEILEWEKASHPAPVVVVDPDPVVQTLHEAPVEEREVTTEEMQYFFEHVEEDTQEEE